MDEKSTRKKKYEPTDDDWKLSSVSIEDAENGVCVSCSYNLTDDAREKTRKSDNYISDYRSPVKHVFEDKSGAKTFIIKELDRLFAE
jgi:hypothetical protein